MGEVDPGFIQPLEHRPNPKTIQAEGIPLIDLSILSSPNGTVADPDAFDGLVKEIGSACREWGFFQVINHGVPVEKLEKIMNVSRKFYCQSLEEKRKVRRSENRPTGYNNTELTKNVRDWKEIFDFVVQNPTLVYASPDPKDEEVLELLNRVPEYPPELREVMEEYAKEMEKLGYKLLELIASSLGWPAKRLYGFFKDQISLIRLNHYPPCPSPQLALGLGRHKDGGALTIVAQDDVGGLEVKRKSDGEWILVAPTPNAFVINVGDVMQVWSNEIYLSVEHRVTVNSEKERFSVPFFFNPAYYTLVKPLEELLDEKIPAKYAPYSWGKFWTNRKRSNFTKLNVPNIQISDFRIAELADKLERSTIN